MTPYAKVMWTALVNHQEAAKRAFPVGTRVTIPLYLITYGNLIVKANLVGKVIPEGIGPYLKEVAEECQRRDAQRQDGKKKPLNALAVSAKSDGSPGVPGDSYDGSGGYLWLNWGTDVIETIRSTFPLVP